jgi:hypothetical protein
VPVKMQRPADERWQGLGSALLPKPDSCHVFVATLLPYRGSKAEGAVSDLPDGPGTRPGNASVERAENPARSTRSWLGRLALCLASIAGEMAVSAFSGSLGYPGLAGVVALTGVVAAAAWIRGLNPRARLPRYALWLFMVPAACLAAIAAFNSGPTVAILTVIAAVLTVGAVLITKELLSVSRLLEGMAFVALGAALVAGGLRALTDGFALMGMASIVVGAGFMAYGAAAIADRDALMEIAKNVYAIAIIPFAIAITTEPRAYIGPTFSAGAATPVKIAAVTAVAAVVAVWVARFAGRVKLASRIKLATGALITFGVSIIVIGAVAVAGRSALLGAAGIALGAAPVAFGVAIIGPRTIVTRVRQAVDWATQVPQGAGDQEAESGTGSS